MRDNRAFCKRCQYDLSGLAGRVCPECGRPFDPERPRTFTRYPRLRSWRGMIAVALLGSLAAYVGSFYCLVQVQGPFAALGMTQIAASTVVVATVPASQAGGPVQSQLFGSNYSPQLQAQYRLVWQPAYRMGGNIASIVYAPIHAVDRMLRPDSWSITVPIVPLTPHPQNSFIWAGP